MVLVTGAGPIGLLAALLGVQRGLEVHVLDRVTSGPKPGLVADLGATYHSGTLADAVGHADVVVECTGVGELVLDAIDRTGPDGIVCLTGVSSAGRTSPRPTSPGWNASSAAGSPWTGGPMPCNGTPMTSKQSSTWATDRYPRRASVDFGMCRSCRG